MVRYGPADIMANEENLPNGLYLVRDGELYSDLIYFDDPDLFDNSIYKLVILQPIS